MTDLGFTQADNNAALEKKFFALQQYIATFEGDFTEALKRRWRIILEKFNKEKGKTYDFRDIEIKLNRNLPSDKATNIVNALKLRGLLSDKTIIELLNMDLDAESELSKIDEQEQETVQKNLENMKKTRKSIGSTKFNINKDDPNKQFEQNEEVAQENIKQLDKITKVKENIKE